MSNDNFMEIVRDNKRLYRLIEQINSVLIDDDLSAEQRIVVIARLIEVAVGQPYEPR